MTASMRIALVTGGSRGIGRAIATALSDADTFIYVNYRSGKEQAEEAVGEIQSKGGKAKALGFDVADSKAVNQAFDKIAQEHGGVDILVNNAGISIDNLVLRAKDSDLEAVFNTNLKGAFYCTRVALKTMLRRKNHGRILFLSSVVGQMGNIGQAVYASTKAGLLGLMKSVAREVASRGITVNAVAPGFVKTEMTDGLTEEQKQALLKGVPLRRWAKPSEIASVIRFLASEKASYITGQTISVNGGLFL